MDEWNNGIISHAGVKGMKWGVRKTTDKGSGGSKKVARKEKPLSDRPVAKARKIGFAICDKLTGRDQEKKYGRSLMREVITVAFITIGSLKVGEFLGQLAATTIR